MIRPCLDALSLRGLAAVLAISALWLARESLGSGASPVGAEVLLLGLAPALAAGAVILLLGLAPTLLLSQNASRFLSLVAILPVALALGAWGLQLLEGPWIRAQAWHPLAQGGLVLGALLLPWFLARRWRHTLDTGQRRLLCGAAALAILVACLYADARVLPGRYLPFHRALVMIAGLAAGGLASLFVPARSSLRIRALLGSLLTAGSVCVLLLGSGLLPGENPRARRFLLVDSPWSSLFLPRRGADPGTAGPGSATAAARWRKAPRLDSAKLDARLPDRRDFHLLWITIDTLRADATGYSGNAAARTPHLDALAEESANFRCAYAQYPSSSLSMASMFKGLYPTATDWYRRRGDPTADRKPDPTLAQRLQAAGRETLAYSAFSRSYLEGLFAYLVSGFDVFNPFEHERLGRGDVIADAAISGLKTRGESPWFAWVHLFDPHDPYDPPAEWRGEGEGPRARYRGEVAFADAQLGRLLAVLREREDWDRTVVVVHSDHGEEFLEHGSRYHNATLYDEQLRVPLLIRIPGLGARQIDEPVELVDLVPTMVELLDLKDDVPSHGQTLLSHLLPELLPTGEGAARPEPLAFFQLREAHIASARQDGVRDRDWKLIHDIGSDTWSLFHLARDPVEQHDLSLEEAEQAARLRDLLAAARHLAGSKGASATRDSREATRQGAPAARWTAIQKMVAEGQVDVACDEAIVLVQDDAARSLRPEVMRLLIARGVLPEDAVLHELVSDADEETLVALVRIATVEGSERARLWLQRLARAPMPQRVADAAEVGRALLRGASVAELDAGRVERARGDDRMLAHVARGLCGGADGGLPLLALIASRRLPPDLDHLLVVTAARWAARSNRPSFLPTLLARARALGAPGFQVSAILETLCDKGQLEYSAPFLRSALVHQDPEVRNAAVEILRTAGKESWRPHLVRLHGRLEGAGDDAAGFARVRAVCAELLDRKILDWEVVTRCWDGLQARGETEEAEALVKAVSTFELSFTPYWVRPVTRDLTGELRGGRRPRTNRKTSISVDAQEYRFLPEGRAYLPVSLTLGKNALRDGILVTRLVRQPGGVKQSAQRHPLPPVPGGRTTTFLLPLTLPAGDPGGGRAEIAVILGRGTPQEILTPPQIVTLPVP